MSEHEPVDAATYAAHLERLDRIGREALAADPAEAITLVREANELVAELLPMHRRLMDELAHHRSTLQAACEELAADGGDEPSTGDPDGADAGAADRAEARLDELEGLGDDGSDVPF